MRHILLVIPSLVILVGCTLPFDTPSEGRSESSGDEALLDPDDLRLGELVYVCDHWTSGWPTGERLILDLRFISESSGPPTAEHEQAIRERGGTILYRYDAPIIRADLPASAIPELVWDKTGGEQPANSAWSVPSLERTDFRFFVTYARPVQQSDLDRITDLGGRVRRTYTVIDGLSAALPDRSVAALRSDPDVVGVSPSGANCID